MRFINTVVLSISVTLAGSANAMDFAAYDKLTNEAVKELVTGKITDVNSSLKRFETIINIGADGVKERAKAAPDDAKLMDLVLAAIPAIKQMKPEQIEEAWGDEGNAGDAVGRPLKSIDQFAITRNYIDSVIHPARAFAFVKEWSSSHDQQALEEAKGELLEVIEHVKKIQAATK